MKIEEIKEVLRDVGLSATMSRVDIYNVLSSAKIPLSV